MSSELFTLAICGLTSIWLVFRLARTFFYFSVYLDFLIILNMAFHGMTMALNDITHSENVMSGEEEVERLSAILEDIQNQSKQNKVVIKRRTIHAESKQVSYLRGRHVATFNHARSGTKRYASCGKNL